VSGSFDVVVIGAGMVGSAVACLLAERGDGLSVAIVEGREPPPYEPGGDYRPRVSAISRASSRVLDACGVWGGIAATRVSPFRQMCVWDAAHPLDDAGTLRFDSADLGEPDLGHIVENDLIQHVLWRRLDQAARVSVFCPSRMTRLNQGPRGVTVELSDGKRIRARLAVGADGAASPSRELAGIGTRGHEYDQHAVVCHVRTRNPHGMTAWQRFLDEGPLAFLPLDDGRCSIVWSTTPAEASRLVALDEPDFCEALTAASDRALGTVESASARFAFPLRLRIAERYTADRFALVGDAAHTVHPLAGQGVNLGFLDAAALAELAIEAEGAGRDPGEKAVLRRYERWRKGENLIAARGIDAIGGLFRRRDPAITTLRRIGMSLVDRAPIVKKEIIRRAMGTTGDLPRFARAGGAPGGGQ
jgi:2-octaprenylphenol hydroxylase